MFILIFIFISMYMYMCIYIYIYDTVRTCIHIHIHTHKDMCACVCHMHVCISTHTYIYIYTGNIRDMCKNAHTSTLVPEVVLHALDHLLRKLICSLGYLPHRLSNHTLQFGSLDFAQPCMHAV